MNRYIGEIIMVGSLPAEPGCIEAGGQEVSRTIFADLFAKWGTTYGAGDGTTTFNVIDLRNSVPAGPAHMGGATANRLPELPSPGNMGGSATHELDGGVNTLEVPDVGPIGSVSVAAGTDHSVITGVAFQGAGGAHNNVQPTTIVPFLIYTGVYD